MTRKKTPVACAKAGSLRSAPEASSQRQRLTRPWLDDPIGLNVFGEYQPPFCDDA